MKKNFRAREQASSSAEGIVAMERRIVEGIEACRPGSDDLSSPELSDIARRVDADPSVKAAYENVQAWDLVIQNGMENVAVPQQLAERLLARLQAESSPAAAAAPA